MASVGAYEAQVWEALTGKVVLTCRTKDILDDVAWSADGTRLVTWQAKFDGDPATSTTLIVTVEVWDAATGQRVRDFLVNQPGTYLGPHALNAPYLAVNRVRLTKSYPTDGDAQATEIWDIATGQVIATFGASTYDHRYQTQLLWASDKRSLATFAFDPAGSGGHVEVWDAPTGLRLAAFTLPDTIQTARAMPPMAWSPDGRSVALGLDVYAIDSGRRLMSYQADGYRVMAVAWSPDGEHLAAATTAPGTGLYAPATNTVYVLDSADGRQRLKHGAGGSRTGLNLAYSPDGRYLLVTTAGEVAVWRGA